MIPNNDTCSDFTEAEGCVTFQFGKRSNPSSPEHLRNILQSIVQKQPEKVVFDFSGHDQLEAIELKLLVLFDKEIKNKSLNTKIILENLDIDLMKIFILSGLEKSFNITL